MPRIPYRLIPPLLVLVVLIAQVTVSFAARGVDSSVNPTNAIQTANAERNKDCEAKPQDKREDKRDGKSDEKHEDCGTGRHHTLTPAGNSVTSGGSP
jgi:hypothetical protein